MTTQISRPPETREMRLVSQVLRLKAKKGDDTSLKQFLARRRHPDANLSWDDVSFDLKQVIGEIVTDGTLRKWANIYGIPNAGRGVTLTKDEYENGLAAAGITLT